LAQFIISGESGAFPAMDGNDYIEPGMPSRPQGSSGVDEAVTPAGGLDSPSADDPMEGQAGSSATAARRVQQLGSPISISSDIEEETEEEAETPPAGIQAADDDDTLLFSSEEEDVAKA
jgi:hypothetical protein